jgi:predicted TPR repeat methyltransferase
MGPLLRPYTQQLVGVDLSQGMVNKAQERACYDALAVDELVHFLQAAVEQQGE